MKNKRLAALLCAGLMLMLLPQAVQAAGDYTYIDENGDTQTATSVTPIAADTATLASGWYVVDSDVTRNGTITVSGDAKLILMDGFTLTVTGGGSNAGINVSAGNSLIVYGQAGGTGAVIAQGGQYGAGIGGGRYSSGGTINIYGGKVNATAGESAAGIGGGKGISGSDNSSGGTISISGGSVTAIGNGYGAGIGGGLHGDGGTITLSGGTVNATGGDYGAGIGGGGGKNGGTINISGGAVTASSTGTGAGIGGGGGSYCSGGTITISGGNVSASSTSSGAGIGGGRINSDGGNITISGGTITATGGESGAGIGGSQNGSGGNIKIQGGNITATGGVWGSGIGGGSAASGGNITISGGVVKAYAGDYGGSSGSAGIGAGGCNSASSQSGGTIIISGGQVTALGGYSSLDIGRGRNSENGTVSINNAAQVTLASKGIDSSVTTLGTCILQGSAAGPLLGAYENGTKIDGTLIDMSALSLSGGTGYTVSGDTVTLTGSGNSYVFFNSTDSRNIVVSSGNSVNVTLFTADIRPASGCAFDMAGATVNLRPVAANTLSSNDGYAGLQVSTGSSLTVSGSGSLTATGGNDGAGIGGGSGVSAGSITFSGGTVNAVGVGGGAGIGGGRIGAGGTVLADGENTIVSATGGEYAYDIGSGDGNTSGGTLTIQNNAAVTMSRNGTNANSSIVTGTVGGDGAGLSAGTYLNSHKLLSISSLTASPESGVNAFDSITLTANVTGLSEINAQGQIGFYDNGTKIGQASLTRLAAGSAEATAAFIWPASGGTHMLTAQYVQSETADSYYMTDTGELDDYNVGKIEQASLSISGTPDTVTYGDAAFTLLVGGGSGTGTGLSFSVTSGDAVSVNSGGTVTIKEAGTAQITVTKEGDTNYLLVSAIVSIIVNKATPPTVVFPSAGAITYGQQLSASALTGGSGDGSFEWENPAGIPTVINSGYTVVFTPDDTDNYDYTGFIRSQTVAITVNKATPTVTFPTAGEITYEQPLSASTLTGGSGDGSFAWESPATVPTVINSGYNVIFTPDDTDNYNMVSQAVLISVLKAEQAALVVDGIPDTLTYGDSPFDLLGIGGSGSGSFSYSIKSGDAVSVSTSGTVTMLKAGTAQITVTKAGDSNYLAACTDISITVNKAVPIAVFPTAASLTYGQPLSDSVLTGGSGDGNFAWESPETIPTVINSGFDVVFTPNDTDNYLTIKRTVALTMGKAAQAPLTISGIPDTITYGDSPFRLTVNGGSGAGSLSYSVITGNAVTVNASGRVTITHGGTATIKVANLGDDNHLPESSTVSLAVNKAAQTAALAFALPESIVYGDASFQIVGSGGSGSGAFSYQVASGEAVIVSTTGKVTILRPGEAIITAVKAGDSDYLNQEKKIQVSVGKDTQNALVITGVPSRPAYGNAPFRLIVGGGSGTGILSYNVTSGNAVSVDASGTVTILRQGTAVLTVLKTEDDYYHATSATVEINVRRATSAEEIEETSSAPPTPSTTPFSTVTPSQTATMPNPTATDASPSPTESPAPVKLKPLSIQADESTGKFVATISIDNLPEGTAAIQLPSGQLIQIDTTQTTLQLQISQADLDKNSQLEIIALDAESIPMGNYIIDFAQEAWLQVTAENGAGPFSVLLWIAAGILIVGMATAAMVIWHKKIK